MPGPAHARSRDAVRRPCAAFFARVVERDGARQQGVHAIGLVLDGRVQALGVTQPLPGLVEAALPRPQHA
jgi:hypothetical protein